MEGGADTMTMTLTSDIQDRAQRALTASPIYALRDLRVELVDDALLLSGHVASFYHKQLAQEVVLAVAEGMAVSNVIHVR